ncbi:serine/threonine-protein kinase 17B-like [Procambarus clarkii]|uniref:serine/threonine-protein kinase 17B-like n=1 Tax=Procambarus clarkii TaxID=6728 RepID=UPI003744AC2D
MLKEVAFLELLDGAGGAPYVLCTYPEEACFFMTYAGADNLDSLLQKHRRGVVHMDDQFSLLIIKEMIVKLMEIHEKKVVHVDLKSDNVVIDHSDPMAPKVSIIDYGVSTFVGRVSPFETTYENGADKELKQTPWYSYETIIGEPLTCSTDIFGLSLMILEIIQVMVRKPRELETLAKRGISRKTEMRPTTEELLDSTLDAISSY